MLLAPLVTGCARVATLHVAMHNPLVHSRMARSAHAHSLRQAQRAASQPGGAAAIQAQKIFKKIAKVHPPLADNQHVPVYFLR